MGRCQNIHGITEGKALPEFSFVLISAMDKYKLALTVWRGRFEESLPFDDALSDIVLKECWRAAEYRIETAESLISKDNIESELSRVTVLHKADETYEITVRSLFDMLKAADINRKYGGKEKLKENVDAVIEKIKELIQKDNDYSSTPSSKKNK